MLKRRALDAGADHHFIFWMLIGWLASGCAMFALLDIRGLHNAIWPSVVVTAPVLGAHIYALRALKNRRPPQLSVALASLAYLPAFIICGFLTDWREAVHLPFTGVLFASMSFGLFLPGLAPPLALFAAHKIVTKNPSQLRLAISIGLLTAAWVLSGFAAWVISHV